MVGNSPNPCTGPGGPLVMWVYDRIIPESHRFMSRDEHGRLVTVQRDRLAALVAEIVIEHTADLRAQLDAAEGVIGQLEDEIRAGRSDA